MNTMKTMKTKRTKPGSVYTLFGFRITSPEETGWVHVDERGFVEAVPDREDATEFGFRDPSSAVEFVNSELPSWKFHAVKGFPLSAVNSRNA